MPVLIHTAQFGSTLRLTLGKVSPVSLYAYKARRPIPQDKPLRSNLPASIVDLRGILRSSLGAAHLAQGPDPVIS